MTQKTPILISKLWIPDRSDGIQPRICRTLTKSVLEKRLTTITAGPGWGKTTLAAQALKQVKACMVWLRLDREDTHLATFLNGLVRGFQRHFPEFSPPAPEYCTGSSDPAVDEIPFRQLLAELETHLQQDLVLVLDEFHWVQHSGAIAAGLNFILRQASPTFHMVVISRGSIPLPLSRLKAQQQVLEITSADLEFSGEEARQLFNIWFHAPWDSDLIDRIWGLTQGWISGLALFHYAFESCTPEAVRGFMDRAAPLPSVIAAYFEEEVFSQAQSEIKDFLIKTSTLTCMRPDFCDEFLGINKAKKILEHLASLHLFTSKVNPDSDGYAYHRLFRIFLKDKCTRVLPEKIIANLHRKAAGLYMEKAGIENALEHFLAVADFKEVACLLNTHGRQLFQEGKYQVLKTCLDALPDPYIDGSPWVLCLYGQVQGVCGNPKEATQTYDRALAEFARQGKAEGINLCRIETSLNYYLAGQFSQAAQGLEELLAQPAISDELRIEALGYLIFLTAHFRHKNAWHHYYEICQSVLADLDTLTLTSHQTIWLDIYRGYTCIATGEYEKALAIGRSIEWRLRQMEGLNDFFGHYGLAASACNTLSRFEEGMAYARKGLACLAGEDSLSSSLPVWQPAGLTPGGIRDRGRRDTTLPLILLHAARSAFGLGNPEECITYARQSTELFRAMGARWGEALGMNTLCTAYARKGDMALAEQSALSGLSLLKGLDLPLTKGTLAGNLAVILMMGQRYEEALPLIRLSETAFAPFGLGHWTDLWLAMYTWNKDKERGREQFLSSLARHAEKNNFSLAAERHWIVPYLADTYARGHVQEYIFNTLKIIGKDAIIDLKQLLRRPHDSSLKRAASRLLWNLPRPDPPGMRIFLLGRFRVIVGNRKIRAEKWGNQKVRSLFQYLAFFRARGYANRDLLVEILWPDQDPGKTLNRFHVTMTALRRVLEPDLPDGAPSSYISRVDDTYRIRLGQKGSVDMELFLDEITLAKREKDPYQTYCHYIKAVSAYEGDLLAEAPFCDWCNQARQDLQNRYLHALQTLITYCRNQTDYENGIGYAERYLRTDSTAETIYQDLMEFYAEAGNLPRVASTFSRCCRALHRELDCSVSPETEAMARRLLSREELNFIPETAGR